MTSGSLSRWLARGFTALVLLYLYAPIAVILIFSFATSPRLSLPVEGFTLSWYAKALDNPLVLPALQNSLLLALVSAIAAGLMGTLMAFSLMALKAERVRRLLLNVSLLPAVVPLLVTGIALALVFHGMGWQQGLRNAAIAHVLVCLPFVVLTMNARLETFDFSLLEAARMLGATPLRAFLDVTLPLTRSSIIGAALLAAALSLDEFVATWFNIGNQQSIPVLVWGLMRRGIDPSINAIAAMLFGLLAVLVLLSSLFNRKVSR
jgi:spermidine/putrescine transport system permease protein